MAAGKDRPGYDIVRETWKPILGEGEFDRKWNRVLHDGLLAGSELPDVAPALTAKPFAELAGLLAARPYRRAEAASPGGLEIVFLPSPSSSRRPLRERRLAAGASRSAHKAHVGQPRARQPEDGRHARVLRART